MKDLDGNYLLLDNKIVNKKNFLPEYNFLKAVFEVIRVIDGRLLFYEDHIKRLANSVEQLRFYYLINESEIKALLKSLCIQENKQFGNIKLVIAFDVHDNTAKHHLYGYFIKHYYPDVDEYSNGVKMKSYNIERPNPEIKIVNNEIRERVKFLLEDKDKKFFEILLVDSNGYIREGSKSNVFFSKGNKLYTAPGDSVLQGITRKYVIKICKENNIELNEQKIRYSDIHEFESSFITGTSPKVLPVFSIDDYYFDTSNGLIRFIMKKYDEEIEKYIAQAKKNV